MGRRSSNSKYITNVSESSDGSKIRVREGKGDAGFVGGRPGSDALFVSPHRAGCVPFFFLGGRSLAHILRPISAFSCSNSRSFLLEPNSQMNHRQKTTTFEGHIYWQKA